jgi:hypothetical protein
MTEVTEFQRHGATRSNGMQHVAESESVNRGMRTAGAARRRGARWQGQRRILPGQCADKSEKSDHSRACAGERVETALAMSHDVSHGLRSVDPFCTVASPDLINLRSVLHPWAGLQLSGPPLTIQRNGLACRAARRDLQASGAHESDRRNASIIQQAGILI